MKLRLTVNRPGHQGAGDDVVVTADAMATVGDLAEAIFWRDPRRRADPPSDSRLTLRIDGRDRRSVPSELSLDQSGIRSGYAVSVVPESTRYTSAPTVGDAAATLEVLEGPDSGQKFPLRVGPNLLGRDKGSDVRLTDGLVSKRHARITVGEAIEIADLGSSNGILLREEAVQRTALSDDDVVVVGDSVLRVVRRSGQAGVVTESGFVGFNRSPRLDVCYAGIEVAAPEPPRRQAPPRFSIVPVLAPIALAVVMYLVTHSVLSILFLGLSPLLLVGNVIEGRIVSRRAYAEQLAEFRTALDALSTELATAAADEVAVRATEHPPTDVVVHDALRRAPLLWARRPGSRGFLEVRLGLGRQPSRSVVELPARRDVPPESWRDLVALRDRFADVGNVPVVASLLECGSFGIAGPRTTSLAAARAVVVQLASLHSPAEVVLCGVAGSTTSADWNWLKWLPHVMSDHTPFAAEPLAMTTTSGTRLVAALEELVDTRRNSTGLGACETEPRVVLLVEDDAPVERSRLVELAEDGPECGIHVVWLAADVERLPAACRTFLGYDGAIGAYVGHVATGTRHDVRPESLDEPSAESFARSLAPVVDLGSKLADDSDLPQSTALLSLVGVDVSKSAPHVIDRWRASGSIPGESRHDRRRRANAHLRASVGAAAAGQHLVLDLREQGPHALVGGTTGSGKSEFLQAWIAGLAVEHSPARVNFLLVDFKGESAFGECARLPHTVGLVSDLTPHLVDRVLDSLAAEVKLREEILRSHNAKSLIDLERRDDVVAPPSLVIVVDEFAALATEVPQSVDRMVDIAQRGRSLGLHLILAAQRPAGVIKGNLRANTNLRIGLRMADEQDSVDVIGTPQAAHFDVLVPGRAVAKVGAGRVTPFQSGYVGGRTSDTPPPPVIHVAALRFGSAVTWEAPEDTADAKANGANDLRRIVETVRAAHETLRLPEPRRPWLDPLPALIPLGELGKFEKAGELPFGTADVPSEQRQTTVTFFPDVDGNMAVYGTGGTGKSTFLRTLAISAALSWDHDPCHVYGLDFGGRGLQVLDALPHVGAIVHGDDHERVIRLLRRLRQLVEERARDFAKVDAGSITVYRDRTGNRDEPRILLLVDSIAAFRQAYETGERARWFDVFQSIAAEGRQVGVHVVVSADRGAAVPTAISSLIQRRLVLRLASETEYAMLNVPANALSSKSPPGRGFLDGIEIQVAVLGGTTDTVKQADEVRRIEERMRDDGRITKAAPVERLPERVALGELPHEVNGEPVLGIADETLQPIGFMPRGTLLVAGPGSSGRTSVLASIVLSLRRWCGASSFVYLGAVRSPLPALVPWVETATNPEDVAQLAAQLRARLVARDTESDGLTIVVENVPDFLNTAADLPLQELVKACRSNGVFLAADGDTSALASSWPLLQPWKAARHGVVLQPDQNDGDVVFRTPFPRMSRAEFPPGRGLYVRAGKVSRVQCALPDEGGP